MRKLTYPLLFLVSFLFFLYINFPFEKFAESLICQRGITAQKVEVNRFPLEVILKGVKKRELPFKIETLKLTPSLNLKEFKYYCKVCRGEVEGKFTYPPGEVTFNARGIKLNRCNKGKLEGELYGKGSFKFKSGNLTSGRGELRGSKLKLREFKFGLFQAKLLDLGEFKGSYRTIGKNLVEVKGKGKGKDAYYTVSGSININPKRPLNSYVNLKVSVRVKKEPLKGKRFTFSLRGSLNNLRLW